MNEPATVTATVTVSPPAPAPEKYVGIPNDCIACEPLKFAKIETRTRGGFTTVKQVTSWLTTKVIFANAGEGAKKYPYQPGDTVYLRGDVGTLLWTAEKVTVNGKEIILVPCDRIQAWEPIPQPYTWNIVGPNYTQFYGPQQGPGSLYAPSGVQPLTVGQGVAPLVWDGPGNRPVGSGG